MGVIAQLADHTTYTQEVSGSISDLEVPTPLDGLMPV